MVQVLELKARGPGFRVKGHLLSAEKGLFDAVTWMYGIEGFRDSGFQGWSNQVRFDSSHAERPQCYPDLGTLSIPN